MTTLIDDCFVLPARVIRRTRLPIAAMLAVSLAHGFTVPRYPGIAMFVALAMVPAMIWFVWASMKQAVIDGRDPLPQTHFRISYFFWGIFLILVSGLAWMIVASILVTAVGGTLFAFFGPNLASEHSQVTEVVIGQTVSFLALVPVMVTFFTLFGTVLPANMLRHRTGLRAAVRRSKRQFWTLAVRLAVGPFLTYSLGAILAAMGGFGIFAILASQTEGLGPLAEMRALGLYISIVSAVVGIAAIAQFNAVVARAYWRGESGVDGEAPVAAV